MKLLPDTCGRKYFVIVTYTSMIFFTSGARKTP